MILTNTQKLKLLQKYFGKAEHGPEEAAFSCPVCNDVRKDKKKLIIRLADGTFHCWICEARGRNFWNLFRKLAPAALHDPQCEGLFGDRRAAPSVATPAESEQAVSLPSQLFLVGLDGAQDPDILAVRSYLLNRGLTRNDMLRWRIAATTTGRLRRKAIVPSFDTDGELNYYVARTIDDSPFKYNNCKRPKTEVVFNEVDVDWTMPVTLVEGVFDAMKCPENTVPVLGSSLPRDSVLFRRLWEHRCKVTVAFDPDLKAKSHKVCSELSKAGLEVLQVWAPDGRDFGSMDKCDVSDVLALARPWESNDRLFFKIRNIGSGSLI